MILKTNAEGEATTMTAEVFTEALNAAVLQLLLKSEIPISISDFEYYKESQEMTSTLCFYDDLGNNIRNNCLNASISILDVGSGGMHTAKRLIKGLKHVDAYTCIDYKVFPIDNLSKFSDHIKNFQYVDGDVQARKTVGELPENRFDIILIDIEPHGDEINIYETFLPMLKETHLCILKHVAHMDLYGGYLADKFLGKYVQAQNVVDYFALNWMTQGFRDVFVIMSKSEVQTTGTCNGLVPGVLVNCADLTEPRFVKTFVKKSK